MKNNMKVNFSKKNSIKLIFVIIIAVGIYYFFSQPVVEPLTVGQIIEITDILGKDGKYSQEQIEKAKKNYRK